jgi:PA domain
MSRPPLLVLLTACAAAAALALTGQSASGSTSSFRPAHVDRARVIDLGGHDRVQLSPMGTSGRTAVTPMPGRRGAPGIFLTRTATGTTVQSADGGAPTLVAGSAPPTRAAADPADLVELDLSAVARDGREAPAHVNVMDLATGAVSTRELPGDQGATCTAASYAVSSCILVPPGDYSVLAFVTTMPAAQPSTDTARTVENVALVGDPQAHVTGPQSFVFDARAAKRVTVATPGHPTATDQQGTMQLGYRRAAANGRTFTATYRPAFMLDNHFYEQPTAPVTIGDFSTLTRLRLEKPTIRLDAPHIGALHPEYYDAVWFSDFASDFPMYDGHARLAAVDVGQARPADLAGRHLHGAIAVAERSDDLSVAEQSDNAAAAGAALVVIYNDGPGDNGDPNGTGVKLQVPTVRLDRAEGRALTRLPGGARVDVRGAPASPYLYDLVIKEQDRIPADLHYSYDVSDLATQVRTLHGQPTIDSTFSEAAYQFQPGDTFSISTMFPFRGGPRSRTEYRIPDPDTQWSYAETSPETSYNALFPHDPVEPMLVSDPHRATYLPGEVGHLPELTAPITAAPNPVAPIQRGGDRMRIYLDGFTDAEGNHGSAYSDASGMATHLEVLADGKLVAETDHLPYGFAALPAGDSQVAIHFTTDNPQSWNQLSTHTDTTWSFPSTTTGEVVTAPVLVPDYDVPVDLRNRLTTGRGNRAAFDLSIPHAAGSSDAPVGDVTVDASWDDGDTWTPASVAPTESGWHVVLPRGRGLVSLRLHAADNAGSAVDQIVVRAFLVR